MGDETIKDNNKYIDDITDENDVSLELLPAGLLQAQQQQQQQQHRSGTEIVLTPESPGLNINNNNNNNNFKTITNTTTYVVAKEVSLTPPEQFLILDKQIQEEQEE